MENSSHGGPEEEKNAAFSKTKPIAFSFPWHVLHHWAPGEHSKNLWKPSNKTHFFLQIPGNIEKKKN